MYARLVIDCLKKSNYEFNFIIVNTVRLSLSKLHQKKPHPKRVRFFQLNPLMRNKATYVDEIAKAMRSRLREVKLADLISSEAAG